MECPRTPFFCVAHVPFFSLFTKGWTSRRGTPGRLVLAHVANFPRNGKYHGEPKYQVQLECCS